MSEIKQTEEMPLERIGLVPSEFGSEIYRMGWDDGTKRQRTTDLAYHNKRKAEWEAEKRKIYQDMADWLEWFRDNSNIGSIPKNTITAHIEELRNKAEGK